MERSRPAPGMGLTGEANAGALSSYQAQLAFCFTLLCWIIPDRLFFLSVPYHILSSANESVLNGNYSENHINIQDRVKVSTMLIPLVHGNGTQADLREQWPWRSKPGGSSRNKHVMSFQEQQVS